jgi:hypothetical protein
MDCPNLLTGKRGAGGGGETNKDDGKQRGPLPVNSLSVSGNVFSLRLVP